MSVGDGGEVGETEQARRGRGGSRGRSTLFLFVSLGWRDDGWEGGDLVKIWKL
jgi:hypothetical protein